MEFYDEIPLRDIERMMRGIPNFLPRGHGVIIVCGLEQSAAFKKRMETGTASRREILTETMAAIRYPPFILRLEQYIKESEKTPMDFRNEKHRTAFVEAVAKLDKKNYALMAALYLLTADHRLWMAAGGAVSRNAVSFEKIRLQNSTENGYTLYCAAKDLYLGTKNLTIRDLADTELIPPKLFGMLCNAMAIRRFGLGAVEFQTEGTEVR